MSIKISVALAAYKGEKYIAQQLRSLFVQTRRVDEIVIGDDSPDDLTEKAVKDATADWDGNLVYIRNQKTLGIEGNFLHTVAHTTGDLIFLCDQDDIWHPEKIEVLANILERDDHALVAASCSKMVDVDLKPLGRTIPSDIEATKTIFDAINNGKAFPHLIQQKFIISIPGHAMAMKRSLLNCFLAMPPGLPYHDVWLALCAGLSESLRHSDRILTDYRVHDTNASSPLKREGWRFARRLGEVIHSKDDIEHTLLLYRALVGCIPFSPNPPVQANIDFLNRSILYFEGRTRLRKHLPILRILFLKYSLFQEYFRMGTGWRALCRDLFL